MTANESSVEPRDRQCSTTRPGWFAIHPFATAALSRSSPQCLECREQLVEALVGYRPIVLVGLLGDCRQQRGLGRLQRHIVPQIVDAGRDVIVRVAEMGLRCPERDAAVARPVRRGPPKSFDRRSCRRAAASPSPASDRAAAPAGRWRRRRGRRGRGRGGTMPTPPPGPGPARSARPGRRSRRRAGGPRSSVAACSAVAFASISWSAASRPPSMSPSLRSGFMSLSKMDWRSESLRNAAL